MLLWTHHPPDFRLDDPCLKIDPSRGQFWQLADPQFRYRMVLSQLQAHLGTSQFLWCCTTRGQFICTTEELPLIEWELDVPEDQVIHFIRTPIWEDLVWSRSTRWEGLFVAAGVTADPDINALVPVPLVPVWVRGHMVMDPQFSKARMERAQRAIQERKNIDPALVAEYELDIP